jgi:hypothetical protein
LLIGLENLVQVTNDLDLHGLIVFHIARLLQILLTLHQGGKVLFRSRQYLVVIIDVNRSITLFLLLLECKQEFKLLVLISHAVNLIILLAAIG